MRLSIAATLTLAAVTTARTASILSIVTTTVPSATALVSFDTTCNATTVGATVRRCHM